MKANALQFSPGAARTIDHTSGSETKYARNKCVMIAETSTYNVCLMTRLKIFPGVSGA